MLRGSCTSSYERSRKLICNNLSKQKSWCEAKSGLILNERAGVVPAEDVKEGIKLGAEML